jgi:hypothetical protein
VIEPQDWIDYVAFVDMSGGSDDDATLGIAHWSRGKAILDLLAEQDGFPPFNPRLAVSKFAELCKRYRCSEVRGDSYAGQTFRNDFADCGISYIVEKKSRTDLYEDLEVALNADQVELLDQAKLKRQLLTIVRRGASLDHLPGQHDDWVTAAAGALTLANPDLGAETPHILEYYRRLSEAKIIATSQTERYGHMQIGGAPVLIKDPVKVLVPQLHDISAMIGASGLSHPVTVEAGDRVIWISREDATALLTSGTPNAATWCEPNRQLASELKANKPPAPVSIRWADLIEDQPRSPFDRGGICADTFRMVRGF